MWYHNKQLKKFNLLNPEFSNNFAILSDFFTISDSKSHYILNI